MFQTNFGAVVARQIVKRTGDVARGNMQTTVADT